MVLSWATVKPSKARVVGLSLLPVAVLLVMGVTTPYLSRVTSSSSTSEEDPAKEEATPAARSPGVQSPSVGALLQKFCQSHQQ